MLRHVAYGCLVLGFVAFGWYGLARWAGASRGKDRTPKSLDTAQDEIPLAAGALTRAKMHQEVVRGFPWPALREEIPRYKRDLPPDPATPSVYDQTRVITEKLTRLTVHMPHGPQTWPQIVAALRKEIEPLGVKVLTGPASFAPPEAYAIDIPESAGWNGFHFVSWMYVASQQLVGYQICSEGIAVGTNLAINWEMREATLLELRRRVASEHNAPILQSEFRPDFVDATMGALANIVHAQTGVELVADVELWENGVVVKWRGEPRPLRDALDQLCVKLHTYWRWRDGKVWLLRP